MFFPPRNEKPGLDAPFEPQWFMFTASSTDGKHEQHMVPHEEWKHELSIECVCGPFFAFHPLGARMVRHFALDSNYYEFGDETGPDSDEMAPL